MQEDCSSGDDNSNGTGVVSSKTLTLMMVPVMMMKMRPMAYEVGRILILANGCLRLIVKLLNSHTDLF